MTRKIFPKLFTLALVLALAGCASVPPAVRTERVEVPVPVPCVTPEIPVPAWALDVLPADAGLYEQVRAALVEIEQRRGYEALLVAGLAACR